MPASRLLLALPAAVVVAAWIPAAAPAAWTPPTLLNGPSAQLGFAASGEAGRLAVAGTALDGSLVAAGHAPGGAFGAPAAVAGGSEDFLATIGPGGAIAAHDGDRPTVRRLRADGTASAPANVGNPNDLIVGAPALAPSGSLLVVVTDDNGTTRLWRQGADGQPAAPLAVDVPDDTAVASIVATGEDRFLVALGAPNPSATPGVRIRTITVDGATGVPGAPVETTTGEEDFPAELEAVAGPDPTVAYALVTGTTVAVKVASAATPVPRTLASADSETSNLGTVHGAYTGAGLAITWTLTDEDGNSTTGFSVSLSAGRAGCTGSTGLSSTDVVDRSGPTLVGLADDGTVGIGATDASCAAPTLRFSAPVTDAADLTAAVDADATVLALVGQGDAGTGTVVADDVTGPVLGDPRAPASVRSGAPFGVSIDADDPWGLVDVSWTADRREQGHGRAVTIAGLAAGSHRIEATAVNAAGLTARRGADVTAADDAPPPPPPDQPVADVVPPSITGVALQASLFAPRAAGLPRGSSVRFKLSEDARVRMTILRESVRRGGRRSRCVGRGAATSSAAKQTGRVLTITRDLRAGPNALALTGRDAKGRRLPRGRYRLSLRAADRAANLSAIRYARFTLC